MSRIHKLYELHDFYNEEEFGNKLLPINILIKKSKTCDGYYEHACSKDIPVKKRLHAATITIAEHCWKEDSVEGTLIHEMIHQYQAEVLGRTTNHDAIFNSMARRLEKKYGISIR